MTVKTIRVAFILSLCLHAALLGVSAFFAPKVRVSPVICAVTLIEGAPKKSSKNIKVQEVKKQAQVKEVKKQKRPSDTDKPPVEKTSKPDLPEKKISPPEVKELEKAEKIQAVKEKDYKEVQEAIARISQEKARESVRKSIEDIQQKLVEENEIKRELPAQGQNKPAAKGYDVRVIESYRAQLWELIKSHWSIPEIALDAGRNLEARIEIQLSNDGSILDMKFTKSSGDPSFDSSAWRAIKLVEHFPPFPPGMATDSEELEVPFVR